MSRRSIADVPPERWAEIQTILHLYFSFFEVNEKMGRIGAAIYLRDIENPLHAITQRAYEFEARAALNAYYLDTFMGLEEKGTPKEKLKNPSFIADPNKSYEFWTQYIELLFDKKTGLLSYDVLEQARLLFSAGMQTSHTQGHGAPYQEFLPNTIKEEQPPGS